MTSYRLLRTPFRYTFWNAALFLIAVNLGVYMLTRIEPVFYQYLSLNPRLVLGQGMFWQVATYQFVHADMGHLFFNMLALFFFGTSVEKRLGSKEFILLYFTAGVVCGVLSLFLYIATSAWNVFLMGASGVVFAMLLAYAVFFPRSVIYIWAIIPIPAPLLVIGYAVLEVYYMLAGNSSGVAHSAHLFGFFISWLYMVVRFGINPLKVWFGSR